MPELPEVETVKRDLSQALKGLRFRDVRVHDRRVIRQKSVRSFTTGVKGKKILAVERRGKALIMRLSEGVFMVVQLMMTGQLILSKKEPKTRFTKVTFVLSNGRYLHYNDVRLFGRLQVVDDLNKLPYMRRIGPEPLDRKFNAKALAAILHQRQKPIKNLLLDHTCVAGIGNIYASEILFESRIRPERPAVSLTAAEVKRLYQATVAVLNRAIRSRGTSMYTFRDAQDRKGNFIRQLKVYGRDEDPCPRCRGAINRIWLAGRSTFFCSKCQK